MTVWNDILFDGLMQWGNYTDGHLFSFSVPNLSGIIWNYLTLSTLKANYCFDKKNLILELSIKYWRSKDSVF